MSESNDRTIDEVTPDVDVTGDEKVPVSDNGTPKFVTVEQIKDFVADKFAEIAEAEDIDVDADGVYVRRNGELKPVAVGVLADAIIAFAFGKESELALQDTDEVIVGSGEEVKKASLAAIAEFVKAAVQVDAFDIRNLEDGDMEVDDAYLDTYVAVSLPDEEGVHGETKRITLHDLLAFVIAQFLGRFITGPEDHADENYFIMMKPDGLLVYVPSANMPFGSGDVNGPSANTDGKIPQWDGADSKRLKDGLSVATNITSSATDSEVPTAKAVLDKVSDKVAGPQLSANGNIPQWDGANSGRLKEGLSFSTYMRIAPSDSCILSEKAVSNAISAAFRESLEDGGSVKNAISSAFTSALQPSGAIGSALAEKVAGAKVTNVSSASTDLQIPTAKAVYDIAASAGVKVSSSAPYDGATGYATGCLYYCTSSSESSGLYINLGSPTTSMWTKLFAPATQGA